jgi:hypothetical protein
MVGGFLAFSQTYHLIYMLYVKENERVLKALNIYPSFWKRF